jgi:hypothetical protein
VEEGVGTARCAEEMLDRRGVRRSVASRSSFAAAKRMRGVRACLWDDDAGGDEEDYALEGEGGKSQLAPWAPTSRSDQLLCGSREELTTSPLDRSGTVEMSHW